MCIHMSDLNQHRYIDTSIHQYTALKTGSSERITIISSVSPFSTQEPNHIQRSILFPLLPFHSIDRLLYATLYTTDQKPSLQEDLIENN